MTTPAKTKFAFSDTALKRETAKLIKNPPSTRVRLRDTKTAGLFLKILPSLACSFYVTWSVDSKTQELRLGEFNPHDPEAGMPYIVASKRAGTCRQAASDGLDPRAVLKDEIRKDAGMDPVPVSSFKTFAEYYESWHRDRASEVSDSQLSIEAYTFRDYVSKISVEDGQPISELPLDQVTRKHVKLVMHEVGVTQGKRRVAELIRCWISSMYCELIEEDDLDVINPADPRTLRLLRKKLRNPSRERVLSIEEYLAFVSACHAEDSDLYRDFFLLLLYTGSRKSNMYAMRWDQVDFLRGLWTIPGSEAKAKKTIPIVLADKALEVLRQRRKTSGDSEWVFLSPKSHSKCPHLYDAKRAFVRILKRAKITKRTTMHDLRRTFGTYMHEAGTDIRDVQFALGHNSLTSTQVYVNSTTDERSREAADKLSSYLKLLLDDGKTKQIDADYEEVK